MGGPGAGRAPDNVVMGSFFRKPVGLFTATLVAGSVLLAVGMTAFGGRSGTSGHSPRPLTTAQFSRAAERIGRSMCLQLKPIVNKKPRTLREFTKGIRRITSIFDRMTAQLNGLIPPPSAARSFRRFLGQATAADEAMRRADHLAETHQWRRLVLLVRSRWWKKIYEPFGPVKGKLECGQGTRIMA